MQAALFRIWTPITEASSEKETMTPVEPLEKNLAEELLAISNNYLIINYINY